MITSGNKVKQELNTGSEQWQQIMHFKIEVQIKNKKSKQYKTREHVTTV